MSEPGRCIVWSPCWMHCISITYRPFLMPLVCPYMFTSEDGDLELNGVLQVRLARTHLNDLET